MVCGTTYHLICIRRLELSLKILGKSCDTFEVCTCCSLDALRALMFPWMSLRPSLRRFPYGSITTNLSNPILDSAFSVRLYCIYRKIPHNSLAIVKNGRSEYIVLRFSSRSKITSGELNTMICLPKTERRMISPECISHASSILVLS